MDTVEKKSMKPLKNPLIIKALFLQTKNTNYVDIAILYNSMLWRKVQRNHGRNFKVGSYCSLATPKKFAWKPKN